jgi:hypothetical protein
MLTDLIVLGIWLKLCCENNELLLLLHAEDDFYMTQGCVFTSHSPAAAFYSGDSSASCTQVLFTDSHTELSTD